MRSCCDENNEVLGIRIGAKRDFFNNKLKHKTLKEKVYFTPNYWGVDYLTPSTMNSLFYP
jgi:hypothetical protein